MEKRYCMDCGGYGNAVKANCSGCKAYSFWEPKEQEPQMRECPDCEGEGITERCEGDCYEGANRLCNGEEEGYCDGAGNLNCETCHGEGEIEIETIQNKTVIDSNFPNLLKKKIISSLKEEPTMSIPLKMDISSQKKMLDTILNKIKTKEI